jgi:hypothetical protein
MSKNNASHGTYGVSLLVMSIKANLQASADLVTKTMIGRQIAATCAATAADAGLLDEIHDTWESLLIVTNDALARKQQRLRKLCTELRATVASICGTLRQEARARSNYAAATPNDYKSVLAAREAQAYEQFAVCLEQSVNALLAGIALAQERLVQTRQAAA